MVERVFHLFKTAYENRDDVPCNSVWYMVFGNTPPEGHDLKPHHMKQLMNNVYEAIDCLRTIEQEVLLRKSEEEAAVLLI